MTLYGLNNDEYLIGKLIGKGGEGHVYEIENHHDLVFKKYNETPTSEKIEKLKQMLSILNPTIDAFAAWTHDIVIDHKANIYGFVMKRLTGYVPLHNIFSPMDRKRLFPEKGYNFLVHVARNLATAFHNLHEAGLVIGDVNEGNILINSAGLVSFIDCDSFQIKNTKTNGYFFCEVGVPRYTPPELLTKGTFENIVRTVNTDSFSLSILIFQLLFLGRHPFAGKNNTDKDIDEETAIQNNDFAYSLNKKRKKLKPPDDSFNIEYLPENIIALFHNAFEQKSRPKPIDWIKALAELLNNLNTCAITKLHTYPATINVCPWCTFRKEKGILYFLDESYLQSNIVLNDIDSFVNGFKIENLELKKLSGKINNPNIEPKVIDKSINYNIVLLAVSTCVLGALLTLSLTLFTKSKIIIIPSFFSSLIVFYFFSPWYKKLKKEYLNRKDLFEQLKAQYNIIIGNYNYPEDIDKYYKSLKILNQHIADFKQLPNFFEEKKKKMEIHVYNMQLHEYLRCFKIENNNIPSLGGVKKAALISNGILNASDIYLLFRKKVPGIGPKYIQVLKDWQRQIATNFIYIPDKQRIDQELRKINNEVTEKKVQLEVLIRKEYQNVEYLKLSISRKLDILEIQYTEIGEKTQQALLDYQAYCNLLNKNKIKIIDWQDLKLEIVKIYTLAKKPMFHYTL